MDNAINTKVLGHITIKCSIVCLKNNLAISLFQKHNKYLIARKLVEETNEAERFQKVVMQRLIQLEKEEEDSR